jgi:hypothetical protein
VAMARSRAPMRVGNPPAAAWYFSLLFFFIALRAIKTNNKKDKVPLCRRL